MLRLNLYTVIPHRLFVYLDYNATTPVGGAVLAAMLPAFSQYFGNPSSENHKTGATARQHVDDARIEVSSTIGMKPSDVIFTSGATEANNLVFHGLVSSSNRSLNILVGATEHKSVLEPCRVLGESGANITIIPVHQDGTVDIKSLESSLETTDHVDLVSVMAANSETGVIHPIKKVVEIVHEHDVPVHCDAAQAVGKIPFDAGELEIDMVTLSSHKIYGPKGAGALVATRDARKGLRSIIQGGGQENEMRSGTLNVPSIVGFGKACSLATSDTIKAMQEKLVLRDRFESEISEAIPDISINGKGAPRLPNTSNIRIKDAFSDAVLVNAPEIEASTGSACASATMEPSHVLVAMGLDRDAANESIRISLGIPTTQQDIDDAVGAIARAVQFVRSKNTEIVERVK